MGWDNTQGSSKKFVQKKYSNCLETEIATSPNLLFTNINQGWYRIFRKGG